VPSGPTRHSADVERDKPLGVGPWSDARESNAVTPDPKSGGVASAPRIRCGRTSAVAGVLIEALTTGLEPANRRMDSAVPSVRSRSGYRSRSFALKGR
jgi:hypothetical protein